jgi:hypothetical protein
MIVRSRRESGSDFDYGEWGASRNDLGGRLNDASSSVASAAKTATETVKAAAGDATQTVKAAAKDAAQTVKAAAKDAKDAATS